jgi:hypothetical protein
MPEQSPLLWRLVIPLLCLALAWGLVLVLAWLVWRSQKK